MRQVPAPLGSDSTAYFLIDYNMPSIERRVTGAGTEVFRARVRLKGSKIISETFPTKSAAKIWGQRTEAAIREGRYNVGVEKRFTLSEAIDRYTREVLPQKPRTAPFQICQLEYWRAELGHLFLPDVTASAISSARSKLLREPGRNGRKRGPATANRYMAALSHLLTVAMRGATRSFRCDSSSWTCSVGCSTCMTPRMGTGAACRCVARR